MNQHAAATARKRPALWHNRDFVLLWSGQTISTLGTTISSTVFPLLVLALTGSPAAAGIASGCYLVPYLLLSLPAGALIDRWNRKRVMVVCDIVRACSVLSIPLALALDSLTVWQLYLNAAVEGTMFVFFNLAETSALTQVVPSPQLPAALAHNEASTNTAALAGPAMGGWLFQWIGHGAPFIFDGVSYVLAVCAVLGVRAPLGVAHDGTRRNLLAEIGEGLRWLWRHQLLRSVALLTAAMNLSGPALTLIVVVQARELGLGEAATGTIFSAGAVGAIAGTALAVPAQRRWRFGQIIAGAVWIYTLIFPLFAIARSGAALALVMALVLMVVPVYNQTQMTYRLALIPPALQGRVNGCYRQVLFGVRPVGALLAGVLLEQWGVAATVGAFAAWNVAWGLMALFNRPIRTAPPIGEAARH